MMNKTIDLNKLTGEFWLMLRPERLHLFTVLLKEADENGQLLFNVSEYARVIQSDRTATDRLLREMVEKKLIAKETRNGKTFITICNYEHYFATETAASNTFAKDSQSIDESCENREEKDKNEKKGSPCTPLKEEKEKKEKQLLLKNNNKNKDDKSCGDDNSNKCSSSDGKIIMKRKRVLSLCKKPIDERKQKFGEDFMAFMAKPCGKSENRWVELKNYIDKNDIPAYFDSNSLTLAFMSHWCQEVIMSDDDGEDVGSVLLFETKTGWNWWQRVTSFVKHGYEIKQDVDARKTQRENQLAVSKAKRERTETQALAAKIQNGKAEPEDIQRATAGFNEFWRLYPNKVDKKKTMDLWMKMERQDKIQALKVVVAYNVKCLASEEKIMKPSTFFLNERYCDEIDSSFYDIYDDEEEEIQKAGIRAVKLAYGQPLDDDNETEDEKAEADGNYVAKSVIADEEFPF